MASDREPFRASQIPRWKYARQVGRTKQRYDPVARGLVVVTGEDTVETDTNPMAEPGGFVPEVFGAFGWYPPKAAPLLDWHFGFNFIRLGFYALGVGRYQVDEIRAGAALLAEAVDGRGVFRAQARIIEPGEVVPAWVQNIPGGSTLTIPHGVVAELAGVDAAELLAPEEDGAAWSAWYRLPRPAGAALVDINCPAGLWQEKTGVYSSASIEFELEVRSESGDNPFGGLHVVEVEGAEPTTLDLLLGRTDRAFRRTVHVTFPTADRWEFRVRRSTTINPPLSADSWQTDAELVRVASFEVLPPSTTYEPATTLLAMAELSTEDHIGRTNEEFEGLSSLNVLATRELRRVTRTGLETAPVPTSRMADALAYVLTDPAFGAMEESEIDWGRLGAIQDELDVVGAGVAHFRGIFDDELATDEAVATIGNIARVVSLREGGRVTFARDAAKSIEATLINARVKAPDLEERTFAFRAVDDPDGVVVKWRDPVLDYREAELVYPLGSSPIRPVDLDLTGAATWEAAYRRAAFEFASLRIRRHTLSTQMLAEGRILRPFDRVRISDSLAEDAARFEGELASSDPFPSATRVRLDRPVPPLQYGDILWLRAPGGGVLERRIQSHPEPDVVQLQGAAPLGPLPLGAQTGYLFTIWSWTNASDAKSWTVVEVSGDAEGVGLELVPYDEDLFDFDGPSLPELDEDLDEPDDDEEVPAIPNAVEQFDDWALEYWGSDCGGASWGAHFGHGPTVSALNAAASTGTETTGFAAEGLPDDLVDEAVTMAAGDDDGYGKLGGVDWIGTGAFHIRWIGTLDEMAAGDNLFSWSKGSFNHVTLGQISGGLLSMAVVKELGTVVSGGIALTTGQPSIIDVVFDPTGGDGGVANLKIYVNRELEIDVDDDAGGWDPHNTDGSVGVGGAGYNAGGDSYKGELGFVGARPGTMTQSEHEAAADSLGLSGGA